MALNATSEEFIQLLRDARDASIDTAAALAAEAGAVAAQTAAEASLTENQIIAAKFELDKQIAEAAAISATQAALGITDNVDLLITNRIGVDVQPYNLSTVVDANYVHTDTNFTAILKGNYDTAYTWGDHALAGYLTTETYPGQIDITIQRYDIDTAKTDVIQTWSQPQRQYIHQESNIIDFGKGNHFELTATADLITRVGTGIAGQEGTILIHSAELITGWGGTYKFKNIPTDLLGDEVFAYFYEDDNNVWIGRVQ